MAEYKVYFRESVEKDFKARPEGSPRGAIPKKDLRRILQRIQSLTLEPRSSGCEKLTGQERYRLRQGRYRIVYSIQDFPLTLSLSKSSPRAITVWIVKVGHRKDAYR